MILKVLLAPREFYRHFPRSRNQTQIVILLILAGIARAFDRAIGKSQGDSWELGTIIVFSILIGGLLGWISFYVYAALVSWTSTWVGGRITGKATLEIMAYAAIPMIFSLVFLSLQMMIYGSRIFRSDDSFAEYDLNFFVYNGLLVIHALLSLYSFALFVIGLSEVQKISVGKAALNALSPIVFFLAIAAIVIVGTMI